MLHRNWKNVRVDEFLMDRIKRFAKSHEYKSASQLTELAIEEYIKKIDAQNLGNILAMLRDDYTDRMDDFAKIGIVNFDEYMKHILLKKEGTMNLIFKEKLEEIKEYMDKQQKQLDKLEHKQPKPEKHRY